MCRSPFEDYYEDYEITFKRKGIAAIEIFSLAGRPQVLIMAVHGDRIHQIRGLLAREILRYQNTTMEVALFLPGAIEMLPCALDIVNLVQTTSPGHCSLDRISIGCILMRCQRGPPCTVMGYPLGESSRLCSHCKCSWGTPVLSGHCSAAFGACWHKERYDCDKQGWLLSSPFPGL